jgi:hypothetical protein
LPPPILPGKCPNSSFKDSPQSKGKPRIKHVKLRFTPDQYDVLDAVYNETQRPSDERCAQLADQMVRVFFSNSSLSLSLTDWRFW